MSESIPRYIPAVTALGLSLLNQGRKGMQHVVVEHDEGCPALSGKWCTCNPQVRLANRAERRKFQSGKP